MKKLMKTIGLRRPQDLQEARVDSLDSMSGLCGWGFFLFSIGDEINSIIARLISQLINFKDGWGENG